MNPESRLPRRGNIKLFTYKHNVGNTNTSTEYNIFHECPDIQHNLCDDEELLSNLDLTNEVKFSNDEESLYKMSVKSESDNIKVSVNDRLIRNLSQHSMREGKSSYHNTYKNLILRDEDRDEKFKPMDKKNTRDKNYKENSNVKKPINDRYARNLSRHSISEGKGNKTYIVDKKGLRDEKFDDNKSANSSRYSHITSRYKYIKEPVNVDAKSTDSKHEVKKVEKKYNHITSRYKYIKPAPEASQLTNLEDEKPKSMDWNDYHELHVIHNYLDKLEADYPSICTVASIGNSIQGREIKIIKISNSDVSNDSIWIDSGIHAREWIAPAVNTYLIDYIAKNFDALPPSMRNKDWYFVPVLNPDGYVYTHTKERLWRKNRAVFGGACVGVDLNRNFSYGWGERGSSDVPTHAFFRGPRPFSEPEAAAVRDFFLNSDIQFKTYITLHSYGQVIIFPYACTPVLCPDYIRLLEGATVMSKAIYETNGNIYKVGTSKDVMYPAAGTSNDWSYGTAKIPYCYLIELRSKKHKFKLPKEEIAETGQEILNCVTALVDFIDNRSACKINSDSKINLRTKTELVYKVANLSRNSQIWVVKFTNEGQRFFVKSLDTVGAINIWKEEHSTMDILVEAPRTAQVAEMLHEKDIRYSVAITDITVMLLKESSASIRSSRRSSASSYCKRVKRVASVKPRATKSQPMILGRTFSMRYHKRRPNKSLTTKARTMDWTNYHRLDVIYAFLDNLAREYPYLCTVCVIGQSVEKRDLKMLKISNGNVDNTAVWIDGTIHSREWISAAVVTYIANRLVRAYDQMPESVTNKDWYILPVLNPDGYEYTFTTDRLWRKNRRRHGECIGVDLNRNFSCGWAEKGEEGSSEDPGSIFFRGLKPFSEPESAAVRDTILYSNTTFKVFLSIHSYGEVIIFPYGYTNEPIPDYVELLEGGTAIAKAIHQTSGRTYKVGGTKDLMYYASGTSIDWSYSVAHIPYSYMIELRDKRHRFLLPKEEIIATATEIMNGVLKLMQFVDRKCSGPQSCVCPK